MMCKTEDRYRRGGFTLIEVLLVVAILGILAAVVVVNVGGRREQAMVEATRTSISALSGAVDLYEVDTGRYPTGLESLVQDDGAPNWSGPYIKGGLQGDPWGTAFAYKKRAEGGYEIRSAGPDMAMGTEDDITSF
ncbi:MAG: type II secretion system major pseudopilin GspG [Lentisphaerae bacterium]|nr:type II secretion system major pseudopilin GspG [Lentisphaerota bacterium]